MNRVQRAADGNVILELRHRWADGTTHLRFDPIELLQRLAALTPRPRSNLVLFTGCSERAPQWRREVCPGATPAEYAVYPSYRPIEQVMAYRE